MFVEVWSPKLGNAVIKATCAAFLHHPHVSVLGNTLLSNCLPHSVLLTQLIRWAVHCSLVSDLFCTH